MGSEVLVRISGLTLVSTASPGESGSKILKYSLISAFKAYFADSGCFASNNRCTFRDFFARRGLLRCHLQLLHILKIQHALIGN